MTYCNRTTQRTWMSRSTVFLIIFNARNVLLYFSNATNDSFLMNIYWQLSYEISTLAELELLRDKFVDAVML